MLKVITPPSELITYTEAATFLRIDYPASEQAVIETYITAARQAIEEYIRRAIGVQTLELTIDDFPRYGKKAILLRPPLISLTTFTYIDTNGDPQTPVLDTDYVLGSDAEPAELRPIDAWPLVQSKADAVRIRFQTGYYAGGSPATSIELPKTIKTAWLMLIGDLYESRSAKLQKPLSENPTYINLLSPYRLEMGI